jgi:hypothetical protein
MWVQGGAASHEAEEGGTEKLGARAMRVAALEKQKEREYNTPKILF